MSSLGSSECTTISDQSDEINNQYSTQTGPTPRLHNTYQAISPVNPQTESQFEQFCSQPLSSIISLLQTDPKKSNRVLTPSVSRTATPRSSLAKSNPILNLLHLIQNCATDGDDHFLDGLFDSESLRNLCSRQKGDGSDTIPILAWGHNLGNLFQPFIDLMKSSKSQVDGHGYDNKQQPCVNDHLIDNFPFDLGMEILPHHFEILGPTLQLLALSLGSIFDRSIVEPEPQLSNNTIQTNAAKKRLQPWLSHSEADFGSLAQFLLWSEFNAVNVGLGSDPLGELPANETIANTLCIAGFEEEMAQTRLGIKTGTELKRKTLAKQREDSVKKWLLDKEAPKDNFKLLKLLPLSNNPPPGPIHAETKTDLPETNIDISPELANYQHISSTTIAARLSHALSGQQTFWYQILSSGLGTQAYNKKDSLHHIAFLSYQAYIIEHTCLELLLTIIHGSNQQINVDNDPDQAQTAKKSIQKRVTWGDFFKRLVFNATQVFTPVHMLSNGLEPVSKHLDYAFDIAVRNQCERMMGTAVLSQVSDILLESGQNIDDTGDILTSNNESNGTELSETITTPPLLTPGMITTFRSSTRSLSPSPSQSSHHFQYTYRELYEKVKDHYYTYPIRPAITAPHLMINALVGYGLLLPPLPQTAHTSHTLVMDFFRNAMSGIALLCKAFTKRFHPPQKIVSYLQYCYYWLFFSPQLLPKMIEFQQMEPYQRFEEYIKHIHYRNYYSSNYIDHGWAPIHDILRATPKYKLPWDEVQSSSTYQSYIKMVYTDPIDQATYDSWDVSDNDRPPSPDCIIILKKIPCNPIDKVPYLFHNLALDFEKYNIVHDSFFYAIFDLVIDLKMRNDPITFYQEEDSRRIKAFARQNKRTSSLSFSSRILIPIITADEAKTVQLQHLLLSIHNSHQRTYKSCLNSPTLSELTLPSSSQIPTSSMPTTSPKIPIPTSKLPQSGDIRDFNHPIAEIMTFIDFHLLTQISQNQFCGIWPFSDPGLSPPRSKKDFVRSSRLTRSPLGTPLQIRSGNVNTDANVDYTQHQPTLIDSNLTVPSYQDHSKYSPIGLVFRIINSLQGYSGAIDELTTILQGFSVSEPILQEALATLKDSQSIEEITLLHPSPFLLSNDASLVYSDLVMGYTPLLNTASASTYTQNPSLPTGWSSHIIITASPTTIQIELLLYAILRRVQSSLLRFLFHLIIDKQLLINLCHIVELEYDIDHEVDPYWTPNTPLPAEERSRGSGKKGSSPHVKDSRSQGRDCSTQAEQQFVEEERLGSAIIQTKLTLAWCLEVAGTKMYAKDFIDLLESELGILGWKGSGEL